MIHHIKRATRHLIFWSVLATAVSLTALRLVLSEIDDYKADLSATIGETIGVPVKIGRLAAHMRGLNPVLVLKDIGIAPLLANGPPTLQFKEIRLGLDMLALLANRALLPSLSVTLVGAKLTVKRNKDGSFAIVGLKARDGQPLWLLQGGKYEVLQSEVSWLDEQRNTKDTLAGNVDLAVINSAGRHRINMLVNSPGQPAGRLRVSLDFTGNAFQPSAINGAAFIEAERLDLARWLEGHLPLAIALGSGTSDFKIWAEVRRSQVAAVQGEALFRHLHLRRPDNKVFAAKSLQTAFNWRLDNPKDTSTHWRLDVRHFLLETAAAKKWPDGVFSIGGNHVDGVLLPQIAARVKQLDLQEAALLLQFFAPLSDQQSQWLAQAHPAGMLHNVSLFADLEQQSFAVDGAFADIGIAPFSGVPGIDHVAGRITGSETAGSVNLTVSNANFTAPALFRTPLPINKLEGVLAWRQTPEAWLLSSPMLAFASQGFTSSNKLFLTMPKTEGPAFIDLQNSFTIADVSKAKQYLPVGIMGAPVVDWLDHAFVSGHVSKGGLLLQGNLKDFPFTDGSGVFEVLFDVQQLELAYHPQWPHLTNIDAEVRFFQNGLSCTLRQGDSGKIKMAHAQAAIPALNKNPHLLVQGEVGGEIAQAFAFLQKTPLNALVGPLTDAVVPQGNTQVALSLDLPLVKGASKVDGAARLNDAALVVKALALPISQIKGELKFSEKGLHSDTIHAHALGYPIKVSIADADQQTTVNVSGRAGINDLQQQFKMPGWHLAEGVADYQLQMRLPYSASANRKPELVVESNLDGVALNLPGALAKSKGQKKALSVTFGLGDKLMLPITVSYDGQLQAGLNFDVVKQSLYSGHVLVGSGSVTQTTGAGLVLEINQDKLALQDWLGLSAVANTGTDAGVSLRQIKVHSQHALWKETDLGAFDLALQPDKGRWSGVINSAFASGKLLIPISAANKANLAMDVLDLSALKHLRPQNDSHEAVLPPASFPLLAITSAKTLWQGFDLGKLVLETERIPRGIAFKQMTLVGPEQNLVMSGDWKANGALAETRLQGHLLMPKAGQLLAKLGISKDLVESSGVVDFSVNWQAAPQQFSLLALRGQVDVHFKAGRILSIEPGLGRVLGILALEQWIKRLQLDFRDVYQEGLTFNSIKGRFDLGNGKAVIHDLTVDAVPAKITVTGDIDFVKRTVDQMVNVAPKSADAVPLAGTIVGKVTTLVARTLTGKDQDGFFFGSAYQMRGPWDNIEILPLHENGGLFQKTWTGLTDFTWLQQTEKH